MKQWIFLLFSIICYLIFLGAFLYLIGFVENLFFQKTIDSPSTTTPLFTTVMINTGLLLMFGFQHSIMARKSFKALWIRTIPSPLERSTYVLFSSTALFILMMGWQPILIEVWDFRGQVIGNIFIALSWLGWLLCLLSTFAINHFHLFGLLQTYKCLVGQIDQSLKFKVPFLYSIVRHPLYLGLLIAFWFTPLMTFGHLLFAAGMTAYIFIGISLEERDLIEEFGEEYKSYKKKVFKIIPMPRFTKR